MADESKVSALVLPAERAGSGEPQAVAGIPGRWEPDVGYAPEALGLTLREAKRLIADRGLPLEVRQLPAEEVRQEFSRASGSHAPSSLARPEVSRGEDAERVAEPVLGAQGVPIDAGQLAPPSDAPAWVKADIERATAVSNGERGESATTAMSAQIQGVRVAETPTGELPPEVEAQLVEEEAPRELKKLKKAQLVELARERGLDSEGTVDELVARLAAQEIAAVSGESGDAQESG